MSRFRTRSILARAAAGVIEGAGVYHNKEEKTGEESGGAAADEKGKGKDKKKPGEEEPAKISLTQAELDERISTAASAAAKAEADKVAKERETEKTQREEEENKKKGEWEALYKKEQEASAKRETEKNELALKLRRTEVSGRLRDFIAEHHADYAPAAKYIAPLLTVDAETTDADADKQIKTAVEQYVKDNPRQRVIGPAPSSGNKLPKDTPVPPRQEQNQRVRPTGPAARF